MTGEVHIKKVKYTNKVFVLDYSRHVEPNDLALGSKTFVDAIKILI